MTGRAAFGVLGVLYHRGENEDSNHVTCWRFLFPYLLRFLFPLFPFPIFTFQNSLGSLRCVWTTVAGACARNVAAKLSLPVLTTSHVISWIVTRGPAFYNSGGGRQPVNSDSQPRGSGILCRVSDFLLLYEDSLPPPFFPWRLDVILHTAFAGHRYRSFADIDGFGSDGPGRDMACLHIQPLTSRGCSSLRLVYRCTI